MKYIRTEDGVYELESTYEHLGKTYYGIKHRISTFTEEEIIAEADTIYELCDYAIIKFPYAELPFIRNLKEMDKKGELHNPPAKYIDNLKFLMTYKRAEYIIFAAWINKRLVNIAEMNNEGEVELIGESKK